MALIFLITTSSNHRNDAKGYHANRYCCIAPSPSLGCLNGVFSRLANDTRGGIRIAGTVITVYMDPPKQGHGSNEVS